MEKVATRGQILWLKCTKFDFGWGSAPDPAGGAHSAPPDSPAGSKGPTSKGEEGKGRGRKGPKGREKEPHFKMSAYGPGPPS